MIVDAWGGMELFCYPDCYPAKEVPMSIVDFIAQGDADLRPALERAVAEIERLRRECEAWQVGQEAITDQLSSRNREITRLRAVLWECESSLNELTPDGWREVHHLLGIIRAALEGK